MLPLLLACASSPSDTDVHDTPHDSGDTGDTDSGDTDTDDTRDTDTADTGAPWTAGPCDGYAGFGAVGTTWTWETVDGDPWSTLELTALDEGHATVHEAGDGWSGDTVWRCTDEGVGEESYVYDWGDSVDSVSFDPPCVRVPLDLSVGEAWSCASHMTSDSTADGHQEWDITVDYTAPWADTLDTQAGSFDTIVVAEDIGLYTMDYWFADGPGLVQRDGYRLVSWTAGA